MSVNQSATSQHRLGVRIVAPCKLLEEDHRLFASTFLQEGFLEAERSFRIEYPLTLEIAEGVLVEDFGPEVAVITGAVA